MNTRFESAADVEDAYYDAIDECDIEKMMSVWEPSLEIACLLPMQKMHHGRLEMETLWRSLLDPAKGIEITVNHIRWIEWGDMAIHLLEELITPRQSNRPQPPIYAVNTFRKSEEGWHLLLHVNSPAPLPPGFMPPEMGPE